MARVDRYESKLRLMAFMGIYNELIVSLQPVRIIVYCYGNEAKRRGLI